MILLLVPPNTREKLRGEVRTGLSESKSEKCKLIPTSAKLEMTYFNPHFPYQ